MNIKKKLKIVELLFKTNDGESVTDEHVDILLDILVSNQIKRKKFKEKMIKKYGKDVFIKRSDRLNEANKTMSPEDKSARAEKAGRKRNSGELNEGWQ